MTKRAGHVALSYITLPCALNYIIIQEEAVTWVIRIETSIQLMNQGTGMTAFQTEIQ